MKVIGRMARNQEKENLSGKMKATLENKNLISVQSSKKLEEQKPFSHAKRKNNLEMSNVKERRLATCAI
jgi:hypothetical protein